MCVCACVGITHCVVAHFYSNVSVCVCVVGQLSSLALRCLTRRVAMPLASALALRMQSKRKTLKLTSPAQKANTLSANVARFLFGFYTVLPGTRSSKPNNPNRPKYHKDRSTPMLRYCQWEYVCVVGGCVAVS